MQWASIILASIFSGLLGVGISTFYHSKNEKRRIKTLVLEQLIGNRNDVNHTPPKRWVLPAQPS